LSELDLNLLSEKQRDRYNFILKIDAGHQIHENKIPEKKEAEPVAEEVEPVMTEVTTDEQPEPEPEPELIISPESEVRNSDLPATSHQPLEVELESAPKPESIQPPVASSQPADPEPDPIPRTAHPEPLQPTAPSFQPTEPEPKTTADLFSGTTTIADSFQAEKDNSIAATVNPQAVQDLKMAIGINDKFLFINELFEGDPSVYNQAIESINDAGGPDEAVP